MGSSVLDKKTINNYIVSMRNDVRRSKVHTINSMTRQVKKLRIRNGTDEQKTKNMKKAERLIQEIMMIKELNIDDVSKFGLTTTQNLNLLQGNMKAPTRIRVLARLCLHKFIATEVKEFKEKYPIKENQVLKILWTKKKKLKKLKPPVVDKNTAHFEMKEKEGSMSDEESGEHDSGNDSGEEVSGLKSESEEENDDGSEENDDTDHFNSSNKSVNESTDESSVDDEEEDKITNIKLNDKRNKTEVNKKKFQLELKKEDNRFSEKNGPNKTLKTNLILTECLTEIMSKDEDDIVDNFTGNEKKRIKLEDKVKKEKEEIKAVDPFFMTVENKEYLTSQVPVIPISTEKDFSNENNTAKFSSHFEEKVFDHFKSTTKHPSETLAPKDSYKKSLADERHMQKYGFFAQANATGAVGDGFKNRRERRLNLKKSLDKPNQIEKIRPQLHNERYKKRPNIDIQQVINVKPKMEKLHPSWEAKKKLTSIAPFQGKKITFDD